MSNVRCRLQTVLALVGVLAMLASIALAAGSMRTTEATWHDTAVGQSQFGTHQNAGRNHARAVSSFGTIQRQWTSHTIGPGLSEAQPGSRFASGPVTYADSGLIGVLPLQLNGTTCATTLGDRALRCGSPTELPSGSGYAASEANRIGLWAAGLEGIENLSYGASGQTPIRATATCRPGETGQASITAGGPLVIRGDTNLHLPPPNRQTSVDRPVATRNVTAVLQNHQSSGPGWAKAELRLYARSTIALSGWTLHAVLASAECGLARPVPADLQRPTTGAPTQLPQTPNVPTGVTSPSRTALHPLSAHVDEQPTDAAVTSTTSSPTASALVPSETSTSEPPAPGLSGPVTSVPAPPEAADPTITTKAAKDPQRPQNVAVGREFTLTNRGGVELGEARIEDIVRVPDCGLTLVLSLATSAETGADRWSSLGPGGFAEVRSGGSTRDGRRVDSDCEQSAHSTVTALSPGRDYQITISVLLDDSAQQAMLRPDGTAGWIFDLPPLPQAATSTPTSATSTTATAKDTDGPDG